MTYDHTNKVANQGDLIKHFALSCAIHQRPVSSDHFNYLEVHCGRAEYQLKTHGAWTKGVGEFIQRYTASDFMCAELDYFYQLLNLNNIEDSKHYPGSSFIVYRALQDRGINNITLHLCDTSAEVCASLRNSYQAHQQVHVYCEDGYAKARHLQNLELIFIDPPDIDQ